MAKRLSYIVLLIISTWVSAQPTLNLNVSGKPIELTVPQGYCILDPKSEFDQALLDHFQHQQQFAQRAGFVFHGALYNCQQKDAVQHGKAKHISNYFILGSYAENETLLKKHLTLPSEQFVSLMFQEIAGKKASSQPQATLKANRKRIAKSLNKPIIDLPIAQSKQCLFFTSIGKTSDYVLLSQTNAACFVHNVALHLIKFSEQHHKPLDIRPDVIALAKLIKNSKALPATQLS